MRLFFFLDFDGTLAPIVPTPWQAALPGDMKDVLLAMAKHPACEVAIVSGRTLKDLRKRVGVRGITYAGNHGMEIKGPVAEFKVPMRRKLAHRMKVCAGQLRSRLRGIPGVLIENKGLTVSVHYRNVPPGMAPRVREILEKEARPYLRGGGMRMDSGKKVLELKPDIAWNKGKAVAFILAAYNKRYKGEPVLPVYIGDDVTDEDAFRELEHSGITARVGRKARTCARYRLKNTRAVACLLRSVLERCL